MRQVTGKQYYVWCTSAAQQLVTRLAGTKAPLWPRPLSHGTRRSRYAPPTCCTQRRACICAPLSACDDCAQLTFVEKSLMETHTVQVTRVCLFRVVGYVCRCNGASRAACADLARAMPVLRNNSCQRRRRLHRSRFTPRPCVWRAACDAQCFFSTPASALQHSSSSPSKVHLCSTLPPRSSPCYPDAAPSAPQARAMAASVSGALQPHPTPLPAVYLRSLRSFSLCAVKVSPLHSRPRLPLCGIILRCAFTGISSVCVRDDWNCFVAAAPYSPPLPSAASAAPGAVATDHAASQPCSRVMMFSIPAGSCRWSACVPFAVDVVTITSRGNQTR